MLLLARCVIALLLTVVSATAGERGDSLLARMERLFQLSIDTSTAVSLSGVTLAHHDMTVVIDSGRMAYFVMPGLGTANPVAAVYLEGKLRFRFTPAPRWERGQLKRFFDRDSINTAASEAILFCSKSYLDSITGERTTCSRDDAKRFSKRLESLEDFDKSYGMRFTILTATCYQSADPFLTVFVEPDDEDRLQYVFDPFQREQVGLLRAYSRPGVDAMELICVYGTDSREPENKHDGLPRDRIQINHYALDGLIDPDGNYYGSATLSLSADSSVSTIDFYLHNRLKVDSVVDASGRRLAIRRYNDVFKWWYSALYVCFDTTLPPGTATTLTAYYSGDIAQRWAGEFFVDAGAQWYPRAGGGRGATFDMTFRTPKDFAFVACGAMTTSKVVGDTLVTTWEVTQPTDNVSFAVGNLKKYEFSDSLAGSVDVFVNDEIRKSDKKMGKAVGEELVKAFRFFKQCFGDPPYEHITATEVLDPHGEAFAGFLHLGYNTFTTSREFGIEATFRSHEAAHQWWGVGVNVDSYHDQWLSEGFATYAALMYVQAVEGNDMFVSKLAAGRKEINGVRNYIFGSGTESGPIYLGYRTSSTKTAGDYQLIIYKKAALVLHMLRTMMLDLQTLREDRFFAMMRDFYTSYRGKNASTEDFRRVVERYVGEEMNWFFDQWVYGTEIPTIDFSYTLQPAESGGYAATGRMVTKEVREDFFTYIPVEILFDDGTKVYVRAVIDRPITEFTLNLPRKPKSIRLNPGEAVLANVNQ